MHSFDNEHPSGELLLAEDGNFYGTTQNGGETDDQGMPVNWGTVFRMTPGGAVTRLMYFKGPDGALPATGLIEMSDGIFYGTTNQGGSDDKGTVFRLTLPPEIPTAVTTVAGRRQVTLSWTAPRRAVSYNVYQGSASGTQGAAPVRTDIVGTSVTLSGLSDSTTYYFKVAAVNDAGPGELSAEVSATTLAPERNEGGGGGGALSMCWLLLSAGWLLRRKRMI